MMLEPGERTSSGEDVTSLQAPNSVHARSEAHAALLLMTPHARAISESVVRALPAAKRST
jgi:hypothetical protein